MTYNWEELPDPRVKEQIDTAINDWFHRVPDHEARYDEDEVEISLYEMIGDQLRWKI